MQEGKDETSKTTEATETKPTKSSKKVVARKQRYFVPSLGKTVEANDLREVEAIVKKEKTK